MAYIFRYPGAKNKLLPQIRPYLRWEYGTKSFHDVFVGGGSVLIDVAKTFAMPKLFANDKDENIAAFWQMVVAKSDKDIWRFLSLICQVPTIELFNQLRATPPKDLIEKAYYAVFFNRCTFSGIAKASPIGGFDQKSKWGVACRYNAVKLVEDYFELRKLMYGRLTVTNLDVGDYLSKKVKNSFYYLDPPYFEKGKDCYTQYMLKEEHEILAQLIKTKESWLISYDSHPKIKELYGDCEIIEIEAEYSIDGKKDGWKNKVEYLIRPKPLLEKQDAFTEAL